MLFGLFAAFSRFTRLTFAVSGTAVLPFFWLNYWFVSVAPVFNTWLALAFVSDLRMLIPYVLGWPVAEEGANRPRP